MISKKSQKKEVSKNVKCPLVVHTSGTTSIRELKNPYRKGVFYPLQSFSKEKSVDFPKIPICIEFEEQQDEKPDNNNQVFPHTKNKGDDYILKKNLQQTPNKTTNHTHKR